MNFVFGDLEQHFTGRRFPLCDQLSRCRDSYLLKSNTEIRLDTSLFIIKISNIDINCRSFISTLIDTKAEENLLFPQYLNGVIDHFLVDIGVDYNDWCYIWDYDSILIEDTRAVNEANITFLNAKGYIVFFDKSIADLVQLMHNSNKVKLETNFVLAN